MIETIVSFTPSKLHFYNLTTLFLNYQSDTLPLKLKNVLLQAYDIHESMNHQSTSRRQQIDLSDCINLFITEETLEKEDSW